MFSSHGSVDQARESQRLDWASMLIISCGLVLGGCSEGTADPTLMGSAGTAAGSAGAASSGANSGGTAGDASGGSDSGGSSGVGGAGGSGGAALRVFAFEEDTEGWQFVYAEPATLIAPPAPAGDAGEVPVPEGVATAEHDASVGDPEPGSVQLNLPFTGGNQKISYEVDVATDTAGVDLGSRSITVRIRVDSGLATNTMFPAGLKLYVKTGDASLYADSGFINIEAGSDWQTFQWPNVSSPGYTDPAGVHNPQDVRQVGLEFATGDCMMAAAGCPEGTYVPAVVHMDTLQY